MAIQIDRTINANTILLLLQLVMLGAGAMFVFFHGVSTTAEDVKRLDGRFSVFERKVGNELAVLRAYGTELAVLKNEASNIKETMQRIERVLVPPR